MYMRTMCTVGNANPGRLLHESNFSQGAADPLFEGHFAGSRSEHCWAVEQYGTNGVDSIGTQDVDKLVTFEIAIQTEYL